MEYVGFPIPQVGGLPQCSRARMTGEWHAAAPPASRGGAGQGRPVYFFDPPALSRLLIAGLRGASCKPLRVWISRLALNSRAGSVFEKSTRSDARNVLDGACRRIEINVSVAKAWEDMAKVLQEDRIERYRLTDLRPSAWVGSFSTPDGGFKQTVAARSGSTFYAVRHNPIDR
jgi:hypothetical protein